MFGELWFQILHFSRISLTCTVDLASKSRTAEQHWGFREIRGMSSATCKMSGDLPRSHQTFPKLPQGKLKLVLVFRTKWTWHSYCAWKQSCITLDDWSPYRISQPFTVCPNQSKPLPWSYPAYSKPWRRTSLSASLLAPSSSDSLKVGVGVGVEQTLQREGSAIARTKRCGMVSDYFLTLHVCSVIPSSLFQSKLGWHGYPWPLFWFGDFHSRVNEQQGNLSFSARSALYPQESGFLKSCMTLLQAS